VTGGAAGACVLSAVAVALLVPGRRHFQPVRPWGPTSYAVAAVVAVAAGVLLSGEPRLLALAAIAGVAGSAVARLLARHRADAAADRVRGSVVEMCDGVQAELASGQTPTSALTRTAEVWPLLLPVVRVAASGGDVPLALRDLATTPGAGDLRIVAAAWQVAHRTGHGLGDAMARVAQELREAEQTRRIVGGELASARATARLVAALPLAALLMGSGAGADPWVFLVGEPLGICCLAAGIAFGIAGLAWIEALARDVQAGRQA
jgi:tight adherence protein B